MHEGGMVAPYVLDGAVNGELFVAYIEQQVVPSLARGDVLIMDNLPVRDRFRGFTRRAADWWSAAVRPRSGVCVAARGVSCTAGWLRSSPWSYRFGGQRLCPNTQVRTDRLDEAVWREVERLLHDPARIATEYERRLDDARRRGTDGPDLAAAEAQLAKLRRGMGRLIDSRLPATDRGMGGAAQGHCGTRRRCNRRCRWSSGGSRISPNASTPACPRSTGSSSAT